MAISLQTGLREYNGNLTQYTGMLGGLTADIHTLRSLNPETTNRTIIVMYRGPYFLMKYFNETNIYGSNEFLTYKKIIEYYNQGITCNIGDGGLGVATLQGGFAGRTIAIPTTQNTNQSQTLTITVPELVGRPMTNFHNTWVELTSDQFTGLTTYGGLVAGYYDGTKARRVFADSTGVNDGEALEPSPAWEVAEFLLIALDRSGARPEAAAMAIGCFPTTKVGNDIFTTNAQGNSQIQQLQLTYNCQFVQSAFINDLAARYLAQFAICGNSMNFNPGAGDAFFKNSDSKFINTSAFNGGNRPTLDAIQSGVGNAPVFKPGKISADRRLKEVSEIGVKDHFTIYGENGSSTQYGNAYEIPETPMTTAIDES